MTPDEYLKDRLDDQINWYSRKSQWNQRCFKVPRIAELIFASIVAREPDNNRGNHPVMI
ncbi:MAG: hypothetical protein ACREYC_27005 [Gammaproteobacteria bacterium]